MFKRYSCRCFKSGAGLKRGVARGRPKPPPLDQAEILILYNRSCIGNDHFWSVNQIKLLEGSDVYIYEALDGRLYMGAFIWELLYVYKAARIEKFL